MVFALLTWSWPGCFWEALKSIPLAWKPVLVQLASSIHHPYFCRLHCNSCVEALSRHEVRRAYWVNDQLIIEYFWCAIIDGTRQFVSFQNKDLNRDMKNSYLRTESVRIRFFTEKKKKSDSCRPKCLQIFLFEKKCFSHFILPLPR